MSILGKITNPNKDPQLKTRFILLLPELIFPSSDSLKSHPNRETDPRMAAENFDQVFTQMLLPNLTWKAGRAAGAVRMSTTASIALITHSDNNLNLSSSTVDVLTKQVLSCLDDDQKPTRLYACKIFTSVLSSQLSTQLANDQLHKFYVEFIKRLDDQSEEIRAEMVKVFHAFFNCLTKSGTYDKLLYKAHLQYIYENLLLYLDDADPSFQTKILSNFLDGF